ncbi:hypothetical protein BG004_007123 [Podila humilis]|nr:hypothetical protein BG004_007123 [Podila humilis]
MLKTKQNPTKPSALDRDPQQSAAKDPDSEPVPPLTREEYEHIAKPRVLISGGGIGGLTLAILLIKAGMAVTVLEKAKDILPLGSGIAMGPAVIPLFKQLGIYDEFMTRSKPMMSNCMYKENLELISEMTWPWVKDYVGDHQRLISRSELFTMLLGQIPKHHVLFGKRVLSFSQDEFGVNVRCADNTLYHADIIVGADGAYSAIRQIMYQDPEVKEQLSASIGKNELPFRCVCLVGETIPLEPDDFPDLKDEYVKVHSVTGESNMCTWVSTTTAQNTVCWILIHFMDKESYKRNDTFRMTDWGPESAEAYAREIRDLPIPGGKDGQPVTMGHYLDKTPARHLSKVVLEEIVFKTWYHKRAVLIGDACHKMNPAGSVGAITAIHDAVSLANWLSTMRCPDEKQMTAAFEEYRKERYPVAKAAFESSQMFRLNFGRNATAYIVRGLLKRIPLWLWKKIVLRLHLARPQASFLPLAMDEAKCKPTPQPSLIKTLPLLKKNVDDPDVLFIDSPEILARAAAKKAADEARSSAEREAGIIVHTPVSALSSRSTEILGPVMV